MFQAIGTLSSPGHVQQGEEHRLWDNGRPILSRKARGPTGGGRAQVPSFHFPQEKVTLQNWARYKWLPSASSRAWGVMGAHLRSFLALRVQPELVAI